MAFVLKPRRRRAQTPETDEGAGLFETSREAESSMLDSNSAPELLDLQVRDGSLDEDDARRRALNRLRRLA